MGLFDTIAQKVLSAGLMGRNVPEAITSELNSAAKSAVSSKINEVFGSTNVLGSLAQTVLNQVANDYLPNANQSNLFGNNMPTDLGSSLAMAAGQALTSGGGGGDNPVFSGVSYERAVQIFREHADMKLVKKNLFLLEVSSPLTGGESHTLHMLATAIDYPTMTVTSEKARIGTANADLVSSNDAIDITITTYDNKAGELKEWFKKHQLANTPLDGTAGVPSQYAIKLKIVHGVIDEGQHGYEDKGYFRAQSMTHSLSRHEHEIHEISMQFTQLDTFYGW
jgi:hypothetical protein